MRAVKVTLFILIACLLMIIIDTLQARFLKSSPIIHWQEDLGGNSYVDKGILMDTYYCAKEDDVEMHWEFKTSKFSCPMYAIHKPEEIEGLTMTIKDGTLTNTGATIIIKDESELKHVFGEPFYIDKLEGEDWVTLKPNENVAFNLPAYSVDENDTLELTCNWSYLYGALKPGTYRLVKDTFLEDDTPITEEDKKYFAVTFKIEE